MPTAQDVMTTDVVMIEGDATVLAAMQKMRDEDVRCLVVNRRDASDAYGMITQRDICYKVLAKGEDPAKHKVHEIMSKPLVVVNKDLDVKYVARLMANMGLSRAPVIFEGGVQGIVSLSDVIDAHLNG
jgi:CBS domain-containing protein